MHIFDRCADVKTVFPKATVSIGNFDGIHLGHRRLLRTAAEKARELNVPSAVLTFNPHPRAYFKPDGPRFLLMSPAIKAERLAECGADYTLFHPFDTQTADLTAERFVRTVLAGGMGAVHVVVGDDFAFGKNRSGNVADLRHFGLQYGFGVTIVPKLTDAAGAYYGSSRVREALRRGDMQTIYDLTGHWHEIGATVVHGDKRGRTLGYPTANMILSDIQPPAFGVYACLSGVKNGDRTIWYPSIANYGVRPMFESRTPILESHLFEFDGDLYDREIRVRMIGFVRPEMKFESVPSLIGQMDKDCLEAKKIINRLIRG